MSGKSKHNEKYQYDYPDNRELGAHLVKSDRDWIAKRLGCTEKYLYRVFVLGDRTNDKAIELAKLVIEIKKERDRKAAVL